MDEILEWLGDNAWAFWAGLALVLGIVETTTLDLVFLMLAGGAVAGGVAALLGAPFLLQALVATLGAVALLVGVRPLAKRHLEVPHHVKTGAAALEGKRAVVTETVDRNSGLVKLAGESWSARAYDDTQVIEPGSVVDVIRIDGATAIVYHLDELTGE